ncbi:MAG: Asp-tRNA(Asn)/Glu-tRNA(Gln) amidotransferase subunit GatC [SAR202 cluster bacterium]|nr:MAG: Asp-tRNA(Asn)/Glu-tRNA(Gln) amidotransferase subunit GatC [SAR202 cluster bacterium]KAA1303056.1 MAG: Asp-tRNA(Asn)/Glu-tRNA(Gln) amidotransferase subunit GatC [SAR202 cluster bacterium]
MFWREFLKERGLYRLEESADLTIEEIKQISVLTRIAMTDNELDLMRTQMSAILDSVAILNEVDTENVEPTGHSVDVKSVMRDDEKQDSLTQEETLLNAPQREGSFIRIRAVLE